MKTQNFIRILVVAVLFAWPGVETYRYYVAKQQLATNLKQQKVVQIELARLKNAQVGVQPVSATKH